MFHATLKSREYEDISILITADNHSFNYICECGEASDLTVSECKDTAAIFVSHTHIDHFINFDFILRHQMGLQRRVVICGPEGFTDQVQSRIRSYQWNLIEENAIEYEVREIRADGSTKISVLKPPSWKKTESRTVMDKVLYSNDKFEVFFTLLDHKTDSVAYLFKERDTINIDLKGSGLKGGKWVQELKAAYQENDPERVLEVGGRTFKAEELYRLLYLKKGDSVGIIMDHAASVQNHKKIKDLFSGSRKVFIESFFKEEDRELADLHHHSYSLQSAKIMRECKVKEAVPVHFSRKYIEEGIEELKEEFYREWGKLDGSV